MLVAVSSKGLDLNSPVDERFGRAEYFIIYNSDSNCFETLNNETNAKASQGVGIKTAELLSSKNVDVVISGNFGPQAYSAITAAGIKAALWSEGTVKEAIELAKNGQLKYTQGANVDGHWK